jgi:hypothetical protein
MSQEIQGTQEIERLLDHNHQEDMARIENTVILDGTNDRIGMDPQTHTHLPTHAPKKFHHRLLDLAVTDQWTEATSELPWIEQEALLHSNLRQLLRDPWIPIMVD